MKTLVLILGSILVSGNAFAGAFVGCANFIGFTISSLNGTPCFVADKLFSNFNSSDPDEVFLSGVLNTGNSPGLVFSADTTQNGVPGHPTLVSPIDIEYDVAVIDPLPNTSTANPLVISASSITSLVKGGPSGTIGGTVKFCVGGDFDGNFTTDDGCSANGGVLFSTGLSSGSFFTFSPPNRGIAVWDRITLSGGATFGSFGQTFTEVNPPVPEPLAPTLVMGGLAALCVLRRRSIYGSIARFQRRDI